MTMIGLVSVMAAIAEADTLFLRNGEQEDGQLKQIVKDKLVFQGAGGEKTMPVPDVVRVQLQQPRKYDEIGKAGQITDPDLKACIEKQPTGKDYPADGSITLLLRHVYDLTAPGVVKETNRSIVKILRQRGEAAASQNIAFYDDTDSAAIDFALTLTPDGRVLHLSDAALKKESIYARFPEYRRLSRYRFACKEPAPDSILDVQYTVQRKRDPVLEPFYVEELFGGGTPILRKEVVVLIPAAREKEFAGASAKPEAIESRREEDGGVVRLTWSLKTPQKGVVMEPLMPPAQTFVPVVTIGLATSWADAAKAYAERLAAVAPLPDALKQKAIELNRQGGAPAIYNYVVRGIRTVPVPHLHYGMMPHAPGETAARGLANEFDKNFLFFKMLGAAEVPAAFALVKDRAQGPAVNVASIRAFNHSAVLLSKEGVYTTTTSDVTPFGVLPGILQGAPALVIAAETTALAKMQTPKPDDELDKNDFTAQLDENGNLEMTLFYTATGNAASMIRSFKDLDEQELKNRFEQIVSNIHPAAKLKHFKKTDFADLSVPPFVTISCSVPGFAMKAGDLMLFDIPTSKYDAGDVGRPAREHDLFWDHIARGVATGKIGLPKGFKVYSMPDGAKFDSKTTAYRVTIKKAGRHAIKYNQVFDLKVDQAPKAAYADYKKANEMRADTSRQRIILIRS
jgi:hypothetical protein